MPDLHYGEYTSQVIEGNDILRVRKDTYNDNIHLDTAKTGCAIVAAVLFNEPLCLTTIISPKPNININFHLSYSLGNIQQQQKHLLL